MSASINLAAVNIANLMGILLYVSLLSSSSWKLNLSVPVERCFKAMVICGILSCIADPAVFYADGKPGLVCHLVIFVGNIWLYLANIILGISWVMFVGLLLLGQISKTRRIVCTVLAAIAVFFQIVNLFVPVVFQVDANNSYTRGPLFWMYEAISVVFLIDSLIIYFRSRRKGGTLKFFPIQWFLIPTILGVVIQSLCYGVSTIWPFIGISIAAMYTNLQRDTVYRDRLTGLYNRYYLDHAKRKVGNSSNSKITALMLDINGFKGVNDKFGHNEGDQALIVTADILSAAVGGLGTVSRYAGDEFVIILNTVSEKVTEACIEDIQKKFEEYNETSGKPYQITMSIGFGVFDMKETSIENLMHDIDFNMYENKKQYYASLKTGAFE